MTSATWLTIGGMTIGCLGVLVGLAWYMFRPSPAVADSVAESQVAPRAAIPDHEVAGPAVDSAATGGASTVSKSTASGPAGSSQKPQLTSFEAAQAAQELARRTKQLHEKLLPYLTRYCADCHGADEQMAGIAVHDLTSPDQILPQRKRWERVLRMIRAGAMPPADYEPQPQGSEREDAVRVLNDELFNFDCDLVHHAGRPTIQRLNRVEYNNTIRDLFGITL
ncbi:MAG: DUF1587 domain-containing protein, partial [Planctomycetaceae bacterium]|nr:DUF1587 domain-containing protein [Planctomycetaceae bacterium]